MKTPATLSQIGPDQNQAVWPAVPREKIITPQILTVAIARNVVSATFGGVECEPLSHVCNGDDGQSP